MSKFILGFHGITVAITFFLFFLAIFAFIFNFAPGGLNAYDHSPDSHLDLRDSTAPYHPIPLSGNKIETLNSNAVAAVPIALYNYQPNQTGTFEELLSIDSYQYSTYINSNWSNVEFSYLNGTIINAWIESGNSNRTNQTQVYVRLYSIPSYNSTTILMLFLNKSMDILSANGPTGENPTLTNPYGLYNDASLVFIEYANFQGDSTEGWDLTGDAHFVGGTSADGGVSMLQNQKFQESALIFNRQLRDENIEIQMSGMYNGSADNIGIGFYSLGPNGNNGGWNPAAVAGYYSSFEYWGGSSPGLLYNGNEQASAGSGMPSGSQNFLYAEVTITPTDIGMSYYTNSSTEFFGAPQQVNSTLIYSGTVNNTNGELYIGASTGGSTSFAYVYWLSVIRYESIFPSVVFGNISKTGLVYFHEKAIPIGKLWGVDLAGSYENTTGNLLEFMTSYSNFSFVVLSPDHYSTLQREGIISVHEASEFLNISFFMVFQVQININGLPNGFISLSIINSSNEFFSSTFTSHSLSVLLPNGTYTYNITTNNSYYVPNKATGSFVVSGHSIALRLNFHIITGYFILMMIMFILFLVASIASLLFDAHYFDMSFALAGGFVSAYIYFLPISVALSWIAVVLIPLIILSSIFLTRIIYYFSLALDLMMGAAMALIVSEQSLSIQKILLGIILYKYIPILYSIAIGIVFIIVISIGGRFIGNDANISKFGEADPGILARTFHVITEGLLFGISLYYLSSILPELYGVWIGVITSVYFFLLIFLHFKDDWF